MNNYQINPGQSKSMILIDTINSLEASGLNYKKRYKIIKWYINNIK